MSQTTAWDSARTFELVRKCVAQEVQPGTPLPNDELDLVKAGLIDSMGWVAILTAIEGARQIHNLGNPWPDERPQNIRSLAEAVLSATPARTADAPKGSPSTIHDVGSAISLAGWGYALGSLRVDAAAIESECDLEPGTIRERAGIECVCRADQNESELTLAQRAAEEALIASQVDLDSVGVLVATSATFLGFPSLSATLHSRLLLPESCPALDVGGACVGVIHALATAKALLDSSHQRIALVVSAEVNSRQLSSPSVPGEFRGLFGDGACAFVLQRSGSAADGDALRLGDFISGCSGAFASALQVRLDKTRMVEVHFEGEQLARAGVTQLDQILTALETLSGRPRDEVDYFAVHEPNPRLVSVFAQKAGIPLDKIPQVAKTNGNLGSATCGVSLCTALTNLRANPKPSRRSLIFLAAVGPGLLWGGIYLAGNHSTQLRELGGLAGKISGPHALSTRKGFSRR